MNKRLSLLLLVVIVSVSVTYSQKNNIVLWGSGGYSNFIKNAPTLNSIGNTIGDALLGAQIGDPNKLTSVGSIGGEFGVGYELSIKKFLLQTGVGYQYLNASLQLQDSLHNLMLLDSEGDIFRGYFLFSENKDSYRVGSVTIPLLLGAKFNNIYFLAGVKMGINISTTSTHQSKIRSYADYAQFINIFENMPNHGLHTWNERNNHSMKFNPSYMASVEFGYLFKEKPSKGLSVNYRMAAFANYGLNNIKTTSTVNRELILSKSPITYQPYLNSVLLSQEYKNTVFNPLFAGMKFTVVFGLPNPRKCICEDY